MSSQFFSQDPVVPHVVVKYIDVSPTIDHISSSPCHNHFSITILLFRIGMMIVISFEDMNLEAFSIAQFSLGTLCTHPPRLNQDPSLQSHSGEYLMIICMLDYFVLL